MDTQFTINPRGIYRIICAMLATLMVLAGLPFIGGGQVQAAQIQKRSIQLSDAGFSGNTAVASGIGSGTAVKYRVSFTAAAQAGSLVIDFCGGSSSPIIGDNCTAPVGMVTSSATLNASAITGQVSTGNGWSLSSPSAGQIKLSNASSPTNDIVAGDQVFEISAITNPSAVGTFYARLYTYAGSAFGGYTGPTSVGNNVVDYGGFALSTVNTITITARVQESLTFCVTKADPASWTTTHGCDDPVVGQASNYPALTLGHTSGPGTPVLDPSQVDQQTIYSQLSTNANNGVVVNMRNSNSACGGLSADAGTTCAIPAVTGTTTTPYTAGPIAAGTAAFGLYVGDGVPDGVGGTGNLPATAAYHNAAHSTVPTDLWYGMDTSTAEAASSSVLTPNVPNSRSLSGNVTGTYGSTLAYSNAPLAHVNTTYVFAATASLTTPAGIYTANLTMIATGTF